MTEAERIRRRASELFGARWNGTDVEFTVAGIYHRTYGEAWQSAIDMAKREGGSRGRGSSHRN